MSKLFINSVSDESNSPTLDEVYDASPLINNNKNNKFIYLTDSDDSDLPNFNFIDTNQSSKQPFQQQQQQPCCSTSIPEDMIKSLIPEEHIDNVTQDYRATKDVNMSINRYFDGSIVMSSFDESACKLEIDPIPSDSLHHHDDMEICTESDDDDINTFSLQFSPGYDSNESIYDIKPTQTSTPITPITPTTPITPITPTSPTTTTTTTATTTTNRKRPQNVTKRKEPKTYIQTRSILKYTITTTTNFDKHLLAQFKSGIKVSQNNDVIFEQILSSPSEVQSVQWRCEEHLITPQGTTIQPLNCNYACIVYSMIKFSEEFNKNRDFVEVAVKRCETKCVLLIYGVDEYFSHLEPGDITRDTFDSFETYLNIKLHLTVHLANTVLQASDILVRVMRGVKGIVHKKERKFQFTTTSPRKGRSVKCREDQTRVWKNQLLQLPRISETIASVIADKYPTPGLLIIEYSKCGSEMEKRNLLTDITVNNRRVGHKISENIFLLFNSNDANVKI